MGLQRLNRMDKGGRWLLLLFFLVSLGVGCVLLGEPGCWVWEWHVENPGDPRMWWCGRRAGFRLLNLTLNCATYPHDYRGV